MDPSDHVVLGDGGGDQGGMAPAPRPKAGNEHARQRVMVVDDHDQFRTSICRLIARSMDVVATAASGSEAVERAVELLPDIVIMDVKMPGMDGIAATRVIHEQLPSIRIIGHSAFGDGELAAEMLSAGAERFVEKGSPELLAVLRNEAC